MIPREWLIKWRNDECTTSRCAQEIGVPLWFMMEYRKAVRVIDRYKEKYGELQYNDFEEMEV